MYGRKGFWSPTRTFDRGKASGGKTLDFDAGCTTLVFAVHTAALAAQLLQPQRGNLSGALSYPAGFWESCQRDHSDLPQSAAAGAGVGAHRSPRQPGHVRSTAADELRILGRRFGFILHALECRRFATAQARSQRRPARVLRLPPYVASHRGGRAGQPRAPTRAHASFARTSATARTRATRHACCRSRGRRGPVGCPGSRVAARVA